MKFPAVFAAAAALALSGSAHAANIDWTTWGAFTPSATSGTATGTAGAVTVTYTGELQNLFYNYPSWAPSSSYTGGGVDNAPPPGIIQIYGGGGANPVQNTITFSQAVVNPVIAIWSLGQGNMNTLFHFDQTFSVVAGGPSAEYGGSGITQNGQWVQGLEGNGVIQFSGALTSITFTNPNFENWYGFTVGQAGLSGGVPEPITWGLMLMGFAGIGGALRACRKAREMELADA